MVQASLRLDQMELVKKDSSGLERLELPAGHQDIIQGLVKTHFESRETGQPGEEEFGLDAVRAKGIVRSFLVAILSLTIGRQGAHHLVTWCTWCGQDIYCW